jgi:hypothetical protein
MRVMLAVALLLLWRPVRAVTPKTVLTGDDLLKVVANAAYRSGSGANAATVNGPWLEKQLCVRGTQTCFMPLPRKAVEEVCSGKPCWQCDAALLSPGGSAGWGTRATDEKLSAYGYNARHIPSEVAWLSLTQGVDIVPFCALADGFGGIKPTPKKCTGTTALTLAAWAKECGCPLKSHGAAADKHTLRLGFLQPVVPKLLGAEHGGVDHVSTWADLIEEQLHPNLRPLLL